MNRQLSLAVWERAASRCEYFGLPQVALPLPFQIDHVRAEKHGGETIESNLALACTHCNRNKGPNIAGVDAASGRIVRLFNPSTDSWSQLRGIRAAPARENTTGRTTVEPL